MTQQKRKQLLWAINLLLLLSLSTLIAWAINPVTLSASTKEKKQKTKSEAPTTTEELLHFEKYSCIFKRDLSKPIFDLSPTVVVKSKPKLKLQLIGTAIDPGFTYGFFKTPNGEVKMVLVGQSIEGAKVLAIRENAAIMLWHEEKITLTVQKEGI